MLFMTDKGRVYRLKGYQVAEGSRTAKGSHIANLLPVSYTHLKLPWGKGRRADPARR